MDSPWGGVCPFVNHRTAYSPVVFTPIYFLALSGVWVGGGRIYGEAHHQFRISPLFPAAWFLRHLKHGVLATWLCMVTQIPTETAEIPTRMAKFLARSPHDGRTRICVGMTVKRGDSHVRTFGVTNNDPRNQKPFTPQRGKYPPPFLIFRILCQTSWCHISQGCPPPPPRAACTNTRACSGTHCFACLRSCPSSACVAHVFDCACLCPAATPSSGIPVRRHLILLRGSVGVHQCSNFAECVFMQSGP